MITASVDAYATVCAANSSLAAADDENAKLEACASQAEGNGVDSVKGMGATGVRQRLWPIKTVCFAGKRRH